MLDNRLLLTTPTYPYPTLPANDSLTDATGQRFTKGDDIFTVFSHTHCFANHILAQSVNVPAVVLEYPRWEDFAAEVDRGYPMLGISAFPVHLDTVMEMCRYVRQRSPQTQILLGSYAAQAFGAQYDEQTQREYVDHVVHGEGVAYMRALLGEPDDGRPIKQSLMPKAGGTLPFLSRFPSGSIGFLVSGLGCIGGCDFCSTTAHFGKRRLELLSPTDLVGYMQQYFETFPRLRQVFVVEEDHFRYPGYLDEMRRAWMDRPDMMERVDWFGFGSIDHIGQFAARYGWEALMETGIGCIFIGVESKFAGEHYDKRDEFDAREVFARLHSMGIRTVGAWICGWDFHHHGNMYEDLNYFVALYPTYQQLTRLSPFPGTELWRQLRDQDRVSDVPWEDVHFWSGAQRNARLEPHETLNLTEYGYDLLYRTWGPSLLRRLDVQLNGYATCQRSDDPVIRRHRSRFFKRQCAMFWNMLYAFDRFAPNGVVRRRVRKMDEKYRAIIGEPTPVQESLARALELLATGHRFRELFDPLNMSPKQEPFKRYIYDDDSKRDGLIPYRTEVPSEVSLKVRARRAREEVSYASMEAMMRAIKVARWRKGDPEIDDFLVELVHSRSFGFGF